MQAQYVLTEKVLDPQSICEQLHLCSRVRREESLDWIKNAAGQKVSNNNRAVRTVDKKVNTKVHQKPLKQQITFVQISDIHLDRHYAEVHTVVSWLSAHGRTRDFSPHGRLPGI